MEKSEFDAERFVESLLEDGDLVPCDNSARGFNRHEGLPEFYDEEKFKRAQRFYHKNIFAMFFGKFLGLMTTLLLPKVNKILRMTNMSSEPRTAYRRYLSTVFHMCVWYDEDFKPGSKLWKSIGTVQCMHNSASSKACSAGLGQITQKDMALGQFGFIGFVMSRAEMIGVHEADEGDWEAFVHLWRVIGYAMGMDDKYNICRDNHKETKQICDIILDKIIKPKMVRIEPSAMEMMTALVEGMWCMNPILQTTVFLAYISQLVDLRNSVVLDFWQTQRFRFICAVIASLKYTAFRAYFNFSHYVSLWLMKVLPFLAYYKFGQVDAHVNILPRQKILSY